MRKKGEVTWFNEQKGFGFISDEKGRDIFVHYTEIIRDGFQTLEAGELVTFTVVDEETGPKAQDVRLKEEGVKATFL
ncbi:cold-shock protein [Pseudodesulfovibrio sediminis]|uniref:Cold-shock protein n=1 Tax=Pseudodesulfovibrio sediminis TaxID=2810563 RepID=A0ABN6ENR2_9BACT|nr:cold shock domain-containing protein [Pseudodesulfovibrio sediminis]BCS87901.1 cold-shock protein [Pseudodesulfovibrio sediminis]